MAGGASHRRPRLVLLGAGGFGIFGLDLAAAAGFDLVGFLDNHKAKGTVVNGCAVLGPFELADDPAMRAECEFLVSVTDFALRREWSRRIRSRGGRLARLVHPSVACSPSAHVGAGVMINAFSVVYPNADVGDCVIVESHCSVGTEVTVGECSLLAPGVLINRGATVGRDCFMGSGAVVNPKVTVGDGSLIGANAAVVRDIPAGKVAAGSPARILRDNVLSAAPAVPPAKA
ncbi:MAG: NeuD/PglB/VioB family sugar acetyltransferase [Alphaproteobacteria bacterium]|nr:NeuD/PglB/VioB family sugar acetyltransferase [Alphaproteobacteria bacterium]